MGGAKRSVYIFLCSLLGVLLFLVLHRVLMLWYLLLVNYGVFVWSSPDSYLRFLAVDYITLTFAMMAGSLYGIWLGSYWYEQVYEVGVWKGAVSHLREKLFSGKAGRQELKRRVEIVKEKLEQDLNVAEDLISEIPQEILKPKPIVRRAAAKRKPAAKRVKAVREI